MWRDQAKVIHLAFASGTLVLVLGSYLAVFRPQIQRLVQLHAQARMLQQQLDLSAQLHVGFNQTRAEVVAIERRLTAFGRRLPQETQLDSFLRQLDQIAAQTGFHVTVIKPGPLQEEELYSRLPIAITAESEFPELYNFLSSLSAMPRLTKIDALTIVRKNDSNVCDIALNLLIYAAKATDAPSRD